MKDDTCREIVVELTQKEKDLRPPLLRQLYFIDDFLHCNRSVKPCKDVFDMGRLLDMSYHSEFIVIFLFQSRS